MTTRLAADHPNLVAVKAGMVEEAPRIDKLIYQLHDPEFPLRLLPPYAGPTEAMAAAFRDRRATDL